MFNVPDHIENQEAYINATKARIIANAYKTFSKNYPEVVNAVNSGRGEFFASLRNSLTNYGKLTEKQVVAVQNIIVKQQQQKELSTVSDNTSNFIGTIGEKKVLFKCNIAKVITTYNDYGVCYIHIMHDTSGNVVLYKGVKLLGNEGSMLELTATIKDHVVYNRKCQTVIIRPVVL